MSEVPLWLWIMLGISGALLIVFIILTRRIRNKIKQINELLRGEGAVCRVCGHLHYSWFTDKEGNICDWCLIGIPCPDEGDGGKVKYN